MPPYDFRRDVEIPDDLIQRICSGDKNEKRVVWVGFYMTLFALAIVSLWFLTIIARALLGYQDFPIEREYMKLMELDMQDELKQRSELKQVISSWMTQSSIQHYPGHDGQKENYQLNRSGTRSTMQDTMSMISEARLKSKHRPKGMPTAPPPPPPPRTIAQQVHSVDYTRPVW